MKKSMMDVGGGPIHVADFGGSGAPIVLVHGLGGSYANWMAVGGPLSARGHVVAPDLIGFGRTPPAGREPTIDGNVAMLERLLPSIGVSPREPATLVGNSLGGLVSLLYAARHPEMVSRLVLVAAALPRPRGAPIDKLIATFFVLYATPGVGELFLWRRVRKVGPERILKQTLRLCGVDPSRLSPEVWEESRALALERAGYAWSNRAFLGSARSLIRTNANSAKVRDAIRAVQARTLITHGTRDRLVPVESSRSVAKARPDWSLEVMEGAGHVPMLEVPDSWRALVLAWLDKG